MKCYQMQNVANHLFVPFFVRNVGPFLLNKRCVIGLVSSQNRPLRWRMSTKSKLNGKRMITVGRKPLEATTPPMARNLPDGDLDKGL